MVFATVNLEFFPRTTGPPIRDRGPCKSEAEEEEDEDDEIFLADGDGGAIIERNNNGQIVDELSRIYASNNHDDGRRQIAKLEVSCGEFPPNMNSYFGNSYMSELRNGAVGGAVLSTDHIHQAAPHHHHHPHYIQQGGGGGNGLMDRSRGYFIPHHLY